MKTTITFASLFALFLLQGSLFAQVVAPGSVPVSPTSPPAAVTAAPAPPVAGGGILKFEEEIHDFGDMEQGGDASFIFKFTNTGSEDIVIQDAKKSCGCTTPSFSTEPVKPGAQGEIHVKYDSMRLGGFNKPVTVISNASEPTKVITIKGNILAKPADPTFVAPVQGAPAPGH
jgi:hypothetical protein